MATKDLIRRTQFEHIVPFSILNAVMQEVRRIEKGYGPAITSEKLAAELSQSIQSINPQSDEPFDPIAIAAIAIFIVKHKST